MPPPTHKLEILASKTNLDLSDEQFKFLKKVNEFNIEARYPDKKFSFYKLCTKEFTEKYFIKIKDFYKWLSEKIK
ncbi:MAG TPA: HEPN domain-containing protein [bacterium (Candidatus Stahlbacteria)]|nr:HEPN domain-containing protein [Candidatus Stahlbacteria bacterium]